VSCLRAKAHLVIHGCLYITSPNDEMNTEISICNVTLCNYILTQILQSLEGLYPSPLAGKMKLMVCSDWLPEGDLARTRDLPLSVQDCWVLTLSQLKKKIKNERPISTHLDRTRLINNAYHSNFSHSSCSFLISENQ